MECPKCGADSLEPSDRFCRKCGAEITQRPPHAHTTEPPAPRRQPVSRGEVPLEEAIYADAEPAALPFPDRPVGVGGFLKFFAIVVCIIGPIIGFVAVLGEYTSVENEVPEITSIQGWREMKAAAFALYGLSTLLLFWAAHLVYNRKRSSTPGKVIGALWIAGPALTVAHIAVSYWVAPAEIAGAMAGEAIGGTIGTAFWTIVWSLYFLKSKRVANTYRRYA